MDIAKTVADNLTALMGENKSLNTLQKIEAKSGVGFGTIRRAKNGEGNITIEKLTAIAKAFGKSPADLITEQPSREQYVAISGYPPKDVDSSITIKASEPTPLPTLSTRDRRIAEIVDLLEKTDDYGLVAMLEKAKDVSKDYPLEAPKTGASSA